VLPLRQSIARALVPNMRPAPSINHFRNKSVVDLLKSSRNGSTYGTVPLNKPWTAELAANQTGQEYFRILSICRDQSLAEVERSLKTTNYT
jgi:hypothetical protein